MIFLISLYHMRGGGGGGGGGEPPLLQVIAWLIENTESQMHECGTFVRSQPYHMCKAS